MKKRVVSIILALVLVLSLAPTALAAGDEVYVANTDVTEGELEKAAL